jgi:hypothetical protein
MVTPKSVTPAVAKGSLERSPPTLLAVFAVFCSEISVIVPNNSPATAPTIGAFRID